MKNILLLLATSSLCMGTPCVASESIRFIDTSSDDSTDHGPTYTDHLLAAHPTPFLDTFTASLIPIRTQSHFTHPRCGLLMTFQEHRCRDNIDALQDSFVQCMEEGLHRFMPSNQWYEVQCHTYPTDLDMIAVLENLGFKIVSKITGLYGEKSMWQMNVLSRQPEHGGPSQM